MKRSLFTLTSFASMYVAQSFLGKNSTLSSYNKWIVFSIFTVITILLTRLSIKEVSAAQRVKEEEPGYKFDHQDVRLESTREVIKLALFCCIAAILCGMTGIAGGMVLGPLFLTYNMLPLMMSATNQYITLIASFAVAIQFTVSGDMIWHYAILFGTMTIFCAFAGIALVNNYVSKSGKQSTIPIILTIVLIIALLSLPLNYYLKRNAAEPAETPSSPPPAGTNTTLFEP